MFSKHILGQCLKHGHFYRLAHASLIARDHGRQDGIAGHQAHSAVRHCQRHITGFAATGLAHQTGNCGHALNQIIVGGFAGVRPFFAVAIKSCINDAGVHDFESFVINTQSSHGLRANVVDNNIGCLDQLKEGFQAFGVFKIQDQTAFVAVDMQKIGTHARISHRTNASNGIPSGGLDFDHIRPHVRQNLRGKWPHQHTGQVKDL